MEPSLNAPALTEARRLLDDVTANTFPDRSLLSGPFVFSFLATAASCVRCGTSARLGAG